MAYPELRGLGPAAGVRQLVLDGEIVLVSGPAGQLRGAAAADARVTSAAEAAQMARRTPVVYLAFDLLYLDWRPTLDLPYRQRPLACAYWLSRIAHCSAISTR